MGALFQPFPMLPGRRAQAWRHQPSYQRPRHFHAEPELNLVLQGQATLGVGDRIVTARRGDVVLFHPGQDHALLAASDDLDLFVFALSPELTARVCAQLARAASHGCHLSDQELEGLPQLLRAVAGPMTAEDMEGHVAGLFQMVSERAALTHVLSRQILERVSENPTTSGATLARSLRTDPSALSRRFHDDLSLRFVEYRARLRLMAFVDLADRGRSFSRAAVDAGFGSYAQCHRVFTRALGCAPRDYFDVRRSEIDGRLTAPLA